MTGEDRMKMLDVSKQHLNDIKVCINFFDLV